jgi:hypothetical protein
MATKRRPPFDPKFFLTKVGEGRTISKYRKDQVVFSPLRMLCSTYRRARSLLFPTKGKKRENKWG